MGDARTYRIKKKENRKPKVPKEKGVGKKGFKKSKEKKKRSKTRINALEHKKTLKFSLIFQFLAVIFIILSAVYGKCLSAINE